MKVLGKILSLLCLSLFLSDKGGRFLHFNKLQGALKWQRKEEKQHLRKEKLHLRKRKKQLRKRKKPLRKEEDRLSLFFCDELYFSFLSLILKDRRSKKTGLAPFFYCIKFKI